MENLFNQTDIDNFILFNIPFLAILIYFISNKLFVTIIKISVRKNIVLPFQNRSSHSGWCTNLGGVVFYCLLILFLSIVGAISTNGFDFILFRSFFASITILFFIGLKDDLILISNKYKILGQLIAFGIVIFFANVRLTSLDGIMGVEALSYFESVILTFLAFFFIVNAFNLSDGIDGLAASIGLVANLFFGFYFYFHHQLGQSVIAFSLVGILFSFLGFNFSNRFKIIMGDSGSLLLGFVLAFHFITFLSFDTPFEIENTTDNGFLLLFALFSYPTIDTIRVFIIRVSNGRSPFSADRNHLHHAIINKGFNHRQATMRILFITIVMLLLTYLISDFNINLSLIVLVTAAYLMYSRLALMQFPEIVVLQSVKKSLHQFLKQN